MIQLYLIFFLVGVSLFVAIVFYSKWQQDKLRERKELHDNIAKRKKDVPDPLLTNQVREEKDLAAVSQSKKAPSLGEELVELDDANDSQKTKPNDIEPSFDKGAEERHVIKGEEVLDAVGVKVADDLLLEEPSPEPPRTEIKNAASNLLKKAFKRKAPTLDVELKATTDAHSKEVKKGSIFNKNKDKKTVAKTTMSSKERARKEESISKKDAVRRDSNAVGKNNDKLESGSVVSEVSLDGDIADNVEIINAQPKRDQRSSTIVTELVARIKNVEPIEQQELLSLFRNHDFKFNRKVHIYGLNQLTDLWRDIEYELPSARFVELGVAIQLADREGPMSKKELHDFQQMALDFSNKFESPFEFSMDIDEALIQARVLDQMGRRYDSMAVLNVVPRSKSGFRMADIESCARDLGMLPDKNGIFLKTIGQKQQISILYRLACTDSSGDFGLSSGTSMPIHDLVIYMNVPATKGPELVFQEMVKDVNSIATWLDGKVVDREGKIMTPRSYTVLTQQISDISFSMQQDGLIPGDEISIKLF